jgi:hypothetical protein
MQDLRSFPFLAQCPGVSNHGCAHTYVRERVWHASQALRQRRDGALEFRLQTSSRKELTRWILSWMPHVKVLAPRQLRDRVRQRMRQGLARCFSVSGHASQKRMRALRCGSLRAFIQINGRADFGVLVRVGHFARGAVIVIAKVLEMGADLVRHLEGVQRRMGGEEAAVVGGDVQAGIGPITNCSLSFWKRPSTASATLPSTSTWRSREKVEVSGDSAGPVPERWELWELWEL